MSQSPKFKLDLPLLLPDVPEVKDRCVTQLINFKGKEGISEAHICDTGDTAAAVHPL